MSAWELGMGLESFSWMERCITERFSVGAGHLIFSILCNPIHGGCASDLVNL